MAASVPGHYVDGRLVADTGIHLSYGETAFFALTLAAVTSPLWIDLARMGYENLKIRYLQK